MRPTCKTFAVDLLGKGILNVLAEMYVSNLVAQNVIHFKVFHHLENKAFQMGFMHLKIKINSLTKKIKNQFYTSYAESSQLPNVV